MQMHLSHWLRVLWRWAYDRDFHGLPALWFETLWWIKPRYASSYRVRHNRFPSLKLLVTLFKTIGYARSVSVTGSLRSNDDSSNWRSSRRQVLVTGSLRSNDGTGGCREGYTPVSVTGSLRSNDGGQCRRSKPQDVSVTSSLRSNNDGIAVIKSLRLVSVTGSLHSNDDSKISYCLTVACFSYWQFT